MAERSSDFLAEKRQMLPKKTTWMMCMKTFISNVKEIKHEDQ